MVASRKTNKYIAYGLIAVGLILLVVAVYVSSNNYVPKPPPGALKSISASSSKKPSKQSIAAYTVAPDLPKYVTIPAIGVGQTRIIALGLLKDNAIATPDNIYDAGWYDGSSKPGEAGAMFIYAHVSSWTAPGIFYNLKNIKTGDKVYITRGDNHKFVYQVVSKELYPYNKVNMNKVLTSVSPSKQGLNLMTCTGPVIQKLSEFSERLAVFTKLISG